MNINSSSNGLSWTAPVPHFLCVSCFIYLFIYIFLSLSEEVFLTAVRAFERQTKFVKSLVFPFAFSASTFFFFGRAGKKD